MLEGEGLKRCPIRLITYETLVLIKYYGFYKEGYLVNKGPLGCQPAKMIEAFNLIDSEIAKLKEEKEA
jgi:hypothetical protein